MACTPVVCRRAAQDPIYVCKFLGNGSVLLVGSYAGDIDVLQVRRDFRGAAPVATLQGHVQDVTAIAVDPSQQ